MATTLTIDFAQLAMSKKLDTTDNGVLVVPNDFRTISDDIIWTISKLTDATPDFILATYKATFSTYFTSNSGLLATANLLGSSTRINYIFSLVHGTAYDYQGQLIDDQLPLLYFFVAHNRWLSVNDLYEDDREKAELMEDFLTTCIMIALLKQDDEPIYLIDILTELDSECGEFYIDQTDNHGVRFIEFLDLDVATLETLHGLKYDKDNR